MMGVLVVVKVVVVLMVVVVTKDGGRLACWGRGGTWLA
jgi:hypothetical protein